MTMRMVANKHVSGASMRKFKRIHILHKIYKSHPTKPSVELDNPEIPFEPIIEDTDHILGALAKDVEEVVENMENDDVEVKTVQKKTRSPRKKKVAEDIVVNNEENTEDHE